MALKFTDKYMFREISRQAEPDYRRNTKAWSVLRTRISYRRVAMSGGFAFAKAEYNPFHVAFMSHGAAGARREGLRKKGNR
jgi:hypothetical protein